MESIGLFELFVSHVEASDRCLKIWGQKDHKSALTVEKTILGHIPDFENGKGTLAPNAVAVDLLCCARYSDGSFFRARVLDVDPTNKRAHCLFVDYGNHNWVPIKDLRIPDNVQGLFRIPAQASSFILTGIIGEWTETSLNQISDEICYETVKGMVVKVLGQRNEISLLKLFHKYDNGWQDYAQVLQSLGRGALIPQDQFEVMIWRSLALPAPTAYPTVYNPPVLMNQWPMWPVVCTAMTGPAVPTMTYPTAPTPMMAAPMTAPVSVVPSTPRDMHKSVKITPTRFLPLRLENDTEHKVFVSHVEMGTFSFVAQLSANEKELEELVTAINNPSLSFSHLEQPYVPGTICLARFKEDDTIYRAVITAVGADSCQVYFVDYGNKDSVKCTDLYEIPAKFTYPKIMGCSFTLAGLTNANSTDDMLKIFHDTVFESEAILKVVVPKCEVLALQQAELFIDGKNVKELINAQIMKEKPKLMFRNEALPEAESQVKATIAYVKSLENFFIQLVQNHNDLDSLMALVDKHCKGPAKKLAASEIQSGTVCCAFYSGDEQWYRAMVINPDNLTVLYVDYGNEDQNIPLEHLKCSTDEIVNSLKTQAIPAKLHGFEGRSNDELVAKFEELVLERTFDVHVVQLNKQDPCVVVRLIDESGQDIGKLLDSSYQPVNDFVTRNAESKAQSSRHSSGRNDVRGYGEQNSEAKSSRGERDGRNQGSDRHQGNSDAFCSKKDPVAWGLGKSSNHNGHCDRFDKPPVQESRARSQPSHVISTKSVMPHPPLLAGSVHDVQISWFTNPGQFYIQLKSDEGSFKQKMMLLQKEYKSKSAYYTPSIAEAVVCRFPQDGALYRAVVKIQKEGKYGVQYCDYGNKCLVEGKDMYSMEPQFADLPEQALLCQLDGVQPIGTSWVKNPDMAKYFDGHFKCTIVKSGGLGCPHVVQLSQTSGRDLADLLVKERLARPVPVHGDKSVVDSHQISELSTSQGKDLKTGSHYPVVTSFIQSPLEFYMHLMTEAPILDKLQEDLQVVANCMKTFPALPPAGTLLMALFEEDRTWYRGKVLEDGRIYFIDYGNTETVVLSDMKILPPALQGIQSFAVKCRLAAPPGKKWSPKASQRFIDFLDKENLQMSVVAVLDSEFSVDVIDATGSHISHVLVQEGYVEETGQVLHQLPSDSKLSVGQSYKVATSFIESPTEFYFHLKENLEALEKLQADIQAMSQTLKHFDHFPNAGTSVLGLFSEDETWYRGKVLENGKIYFIDYGNSETVDLSGLKILPSAVQDIQSFAVKCRLAVPSGTEWSQKASERFIDFLDGDDLQMSVVAILDGEFSVDVTDANGTLLSHVLVQEGHLKDSSQISEVVDSLQTLEISTSQGKDLKTGGHYPVVTSFIQSPLEFYMHLMTEAPILDKLQEDLQVNATSMKCFTTLPPVGTLLMALFEEDRTWYRGKVLEDGRIYFIDYGNTETVVLSDMKILPPALQGIQSFAVKCRLAAPPGKKWSPKASQCFIDFLDKENLQMSVVAVLDGEFSVDVIDATGSHISHVLVQEGYVEEIDQVMDKLPSECSSYQIGSSVLLPPMDPSSKGNVSERPQECETTILVNGSAQDKSESTLISSSTPDTLDDSVVEVFRTGDEIPVITIDDSIEIVALQDCNSTETNGDFDSEELCRTAEFVSDLLNKTKDSLDTITEESELEDNVSKNAMRSKSNSDLLMNVMQDCDILTSTERTVPRNSLEPESESGIDLIQPECENSSSVVTEEEEPSSSENLVVNLLTYPDSTSLEMDINGTPLGQSIAKYSDFASELSRAIPGKKVYFFEECDAHSRTLEISEEVAFTSVENEASTVTADCDEDVVITLRIYPDSKSCEADVNGTDCGQSVGRLSEFVELAGTAISGSKVFTFEDCDNHKVLYEVS